MKYYLIAGEASGDLHASNLMREIRVRDTLAEFRCWGGDMMQRQGGQVVRHYRDLAFMGFTEVLLNLGTILKNLKQCKEDILRFRPDVLILVDYPGFNLRIARWAHGKQLKVVYYISPQVWAWKKSRVYTIRRVVDRMIVILPFEQAFYATYDYPVDYVGHPLLDVIDPSVGAGKTKVPGEPPLIALLPGSRKQEIGRMLPVMLAVIPAFPSCRFTVAGAPGIDPSFYGSLLESSRAEIVYGDTYALLRRADAALVTSGTASLETALFGVPQVICYRGGRLSFAIAKRIVKVPFIGLPNLVMNEEINRELVQDDLQPATLTRELEHLLTDRSAAGRLQEKYAELWKRLGGPGASGRAADRITGLFGHKPE